MTGQTRTRDEPPAVQSDARTREVWDSLAVVTDPELDESVTALGFVTVVEVQGRDVQIEFHLPTFWCAANFAYMMATDMRRAVSALPWVNTVRVELAEHMYSDTINRGIAASHSFQDTFGEEASDEIDVVREKFRKKAFQQRQELLLRYLRGEALSRETLVGFRMHDLEQLVPADAEGQRLLHRYREIRQEWGGDSSPMRPAFVTLEGDALSVEHFDAYLSELRGIRINTQFNGEICRGLLKARYGDSGASPAAVPIDFPAFDRKRTRCSTTPD